eukprot:g10.t1
MWSLLLPLLLCTNILSTLSYSFTEEFTEDWNQRWIPSTDEKYQGKFELERMDPDFGLQIPKKAQFYGLTAPLSEAFTPADGLILQFEAKWSKEQSCSGAYLKFYSHDSQFKAEEVKADTPYTIMFGPDKCGSNSKIHFIINHKSPKTQKITEKHLKDPAKVPSDKKSHLYTAKLNKDNSFQILLDNEIVSKGNLMENFDPPFNPPEEIPDPEDHKPSDWVDLAKIDDPDAMKPEDWVDEPLMEDNEAVKPDDWLDDEPVEVSDPNASKPADWDEEEDGDWLVPLIPNPKCKSVSGCGEWHRPKIANPDYKGPWRAPKIDNPDYKGEWKAKMIPNPDYYFDESPLNNLAPIGSVGFELWTMDEGIIFDNIIITQELDLAEKYRIQWETRKELEEAKEKEEREKREKERETKDKAGAAGYLQRLINDPKLAALKPYLQPFVDLAEENTTLFYSVIAFLGAILLVIMISCCRRGKQEDDVRERKKKDITEPDDAEESTGQSSSKATNGTETDAKENDKEDNEEEEDKEEVEVEEDESKKAQPKQRSNRTRRVE